MLLLGRDGDDPLFLQFKEAEASVLEPFLGKSDFANHGQRVVEGQRLTQAASDIMLGWIRAENPLDKVKRDFYVRQLWDAKGSALVELMEPRLMAAYARLCATELARAHARSGDGVAIASYLGAGDTFDRAISLFAESYADQNERDFEVLKEAVQAGRVEEKAGVNAKASMAGWIGFAGILMLIIGAIDFFQGLIAVFDDDYYVVTSSGFLAVNLTAWGWIMMIWGVLLVLAGLGLLGGTELGALVHDRGRGG